MSFSVGPISLRMKIKVVSLSRKPWMFQLGYRHSLEHRQHDIDNITLAR